MQYSLLASFAHPDDEAFGTGGTIARYAQQGVQVDLVCATRGEAGEIAEGSDATPETLGAVRENELRCAAETMGIHEVIFLGYRDSGMKGTPENEDPRAYINAPDGEVVSQLVAAIRRLKPQVVVTFEPNGGYGHPDHIAIHRHTVKAFHLTGDASYFPSLGEAWQPKRLFYTSIPRSFFEEMRAEMEAEGIDTSDFERFEDDKFGWPDEKINAVLDVSSSVDEKWDGLNCHRTQFGPGNLFRKLSENKVKALMGKEYFSLAWPEPESDLIMHDLFEGLYGEAMAVRGAREQIIRAALSWEGVTSHPHRFGGTEFRLGKRELGHIHSDHLLDIPFPKKVRDEIVSTGLAQLHHILPETGWISFHVEQEEDIPKAIALLQRSYSLAMRQKERNRTPDQP